MEKKERYRTEKATPLGVLAKTGNVTPGRARQLPVPTRTLFLGVITHFLERGVAARNRTPPSFLPLRVAVCLRPGRIDTSRSGVCSVGMFCFFGLFVFFFSPYNSFSVSPSRRLQCRWNG